MAKYFLAKFSTKKSTLNIKLATSEKYTEILELLWREYYPKDPTTKGLGLGAKEVPAIDDHITNVLMENHSLIAEKGGKLIGCSINVVTNEDTPTRIIKYAKPLEDKQTNQLLNLYAFLTANPALFRKYSTKSIFEVRQICVDSNCKREEVATELLRKSIVMGHKLGHELVRCNATSRSISKVCSLIGMTKVCEIPYVLYVDKEKQSILKISKAESACHVFVDLM